MQAAAADPIEFTASHGVALTLAVLTAAVTGVNLLNSLFALSHRARLEKRITRGREKLDALREKSPVRPAIERNMDRAAAILAARDLIPISPWRLLGPILAIAVGFGLGQVGVWLKSSYGVLGPTLFWVGIAVVVLGEALLASGTLRRAELRRRKVLSVERGRRSGSLPVNVDEAGRNVIWPRISQSQLTSRRARALALWRRWGG